MSRFAPSRRGLVIACAGAIAIASVPAVAFARNGTEDDTSVQEASTSTVTTDDTVADSDTSVPDSTPDTTPDSTPTTDDTTPGTTPTTDDTTPGSTPTTDDTTPGSSVPDGPATAPFTETFTSVGGTITVTFDGRALHLDAVAPAAGFDASVDKDEADDVRVEFDNDAADSRARIRVKLRDGQVRVEVDSDDDDDD